MATAVRLAPFVVTQTSNDPRVHHYYGEPSIRIPKTDLISLASGVCRVCCTSSRKDHETPVKVSIMPGAQSPPAPAPVAVAVS